jgi:hypothetical protein
LPALAFWLAFIVLVLIDLMRLFRRGPAAVVGAADFSRAGAHRAVTGAALAAVVAMLAGGLFEYNFGDSEFLMLFLLLIVLPFATTRTTPTGTAA